MLSLLRFFPWIILLQVLHCASVCAQSKFNQAYEATQTGNYKRAVQLWKGLAEDGVPAAQYALGWMFESGQGIPQDYHQAADWYHKAAEQGNIAAQYVLATFYNKGMGVSENQQQAVHWFLKAAKQGDAIAQFKLALHLQKGVGTKQNDKQSLFWFTKAAEQDYISAQIILGKTYQSGKGAQQDFPLAIHWYQKAATHNSAQAQFGLASMYEQGQGTAKNLQKAESLYLKSANNQYAPSAYKLGEFYEQGKTTAINIPQALKWYTKSANNGYCMAQFKLGSIYQTGSGVPKNIPLAISWYQQAAHQDHAQAAYQLAAIYDANQTDKNQPSINNVNYRQAASYYQKACDLKYKKAYARLAFLYEKGLGVALNIEHAISLYKLSSQPWAKNRFNRLYQQQQCLKNATTKLFSVAIACAHRKLLQQQIKIQKIPLLEEKSNAQSDTYFTGAIIEGTSELKINYTAEQQFSSAIYTYIGRDNPKLITHVKALISSQYGEPNTQSGTAEKGKVSIQWLLNDSVELTVKRGWPDTTTFVIYSLPTKRSFLNQSATSIK